MKMVVWILSSGTHDTNIIAGTQDDDSESECDEQAILVPSFYSNSFPGPKIHDVFAPMENNLDYAEELARLQKQEHEAHSAAAKYGFEFTNETTKMLHQEEIKTPKNLVLAAGDPAGSIVSTGGVSAGSISASSVLARSVPTSNVPAGGVLVGSIDSAGFGDPAASESVLAVFTPDHAAVSPLPPEPSSVVKALEDHDWVAAMHKEMQQFYNHQIAIETKWILKNKRDARVARIEAIRLFLAFALYMGFMVYQIDVKSVFLYEEIKEEVYVTQPKGFEDPYNPKHVYKVFKALYGFHQAPRAWFKWMTSFGSTNKAWCDEFEALMKREFKMSDMGHTDGFPLKCSQEDIQVSQRATYL
nr:hypothetical protein [Tanacetum cinerariifolium]